VAIEVKSTRRRGSSSGLAAFAKVFSPDRTLLIGGDGISIEDFLSHPVDHWILN
jgi:hypothetical protein